MSKSVTNRIISAYDPIFICVIECLPMVYFIMYNAFEERTVMSYSNFLRGKASSYKCLERGGSLLIFIR